MRLPYSSKSLPRNLRSVVLFIRALITLNVLRNERLLSASAALRLKQIGQAARLQLESFFGCKVFLELFVKVTKGWTNSPAFAERTWAVNIHRGKRRDGETLAACLLLQLAIAMADHPFYRSAS